VEQRVEDLEVKLAFMEHHVAQLDELVRGCFARIDQLEAELSALRQQTSAASVRGSLVEELPPHHLDRS
jgi:uncharacterized coiled-coil protein SlyX